MNARIVGRYAWYSLALMLLLVALWCLLWVVSSSSMAFTDCAGQYDLFAQNPRCRQPPVAGLLAIASLGGSVVAVLLGRRFRTLANPTLQPTASGRG